MCVLNSLFLDLESEMYQLSHLLTEQRSLLAALASTSLLGSTNAGSSSGSENTSDVTVRPEEQQQREEEERRRKLTAALEKVEGCLVSILMREKCYLQNLKLLYLIFLDLSYCLVGFDRISS